MSIAASVLVVLVAALHVWFLILETVLWRKPLGMQTFQLTPERAEITASLAANPGLYNGFLAAGLVVGSWRRSRQPSNSSRGREIRRWGHLLPVWSMNGTFTTSVRLRLSRR